MYLAFAPRELRSFVTAMPIWLREKLFQKRLLQARLLALTDGLKKSQLPQQLFGEHRESGAGLRGTGEEFAQWSRMRSEPGSGTRCHGVLKTHLS